MAVRRLKVVNRAAKPHKCERGHDIAKGEAYRYWEMGFRPSYKRIRCMRAECTPRTSERETSNVAEAYAAQESAEDALDALEADPPAWGDWDTGVSAVREAVTTAGEEIYAVGEQYREADEAFGGQGATEHAERADTLEAAGDDLQGWDTSSEAPDACSDHDEPTEDCGDCGENVAQWWDALIGEARDAVQGVELP